MMNTVTLVDGSAPICVREEQMTEQEQGFAGRPAGNYDQRYFQVSDPARGISVTNDSARAIGNTYNVRHRHVFSQVRYFVSGSQTFGLEKLSKGDIQFVGDSVFYGPIESFFAPGQENLHFVQTQFAGPTGVPWADKTMVAVARQELAKNGEFKGGIYYPNGGRPIDGLEAILVALDKQSYTLTGQEKLEYPPQRLSSPLHVHASVLPWISGGEGIEIKHVLSMFDTGPNVSIVRLKKGAQLPANTAAFQQTRWVVEGSVSWRGERFDALSCMFYPPAVPYPATVSEADGTTLVIIQWANSGAPLITSTVL